MKKAIIIGAGPAGLTAAYELLKRTDIIPIILEKSDCIGGISRTIDYKGNRMDMGPHRFFSKSDRVMDWWLHMMPMEEGTEGSTTISYQNKTRVIEDPCSYADTAKKDPDKRMLVIQRLTRIYFLRKFFAYPIQLSIDTLKTLGLSRTIRIMLSFLRIRLFPRKPEKSLEDFIINKFGKELYLLFFKDYTEKVWGVPCDQISAEWGAQRIKGVSLSKAIGQAIKNIRSKKKRGDGIGQKETETSLIEQFLYPKRGPGSLWEEVARQVREMGGKIYMDQDVKYIYTVENEVCSIHAVNSRTGEIFLFEGDYFFSTMPVQELIAGMGAAVPQEVKDTAAGLQYRDFINVGILLKQMTQTLKDNWIYIQERDVKVGRLMIYNNWGGGMINDPNTVWIGMEYFCNKTDAFWALDDETIKQHAIEELQQMELAHPEDVLDSTVRRMEKTYPAYFGTYENFGTIRAYTDQFTNLFLVGRNGMHKYNNADHSMLTAMVAVDNIAAGIMTKENLWSINTEQEYHEEKTTADGNKETLVKKEPAGFGHFLWKNKWNKAYLITAFAGFLLQFILFKIRYPYANYMPDSYSYLEAAFTNADVNMWPVAYSKFLRLISVFTHSDKILIGVQFLFLQASALAFLFTMLYFLRPAKAVRNILWFFFLVNPIPFYISNYVSADALFIGCSLLWLTTLLWILFRPQPAQIFIQAILLLACFTLRYNAIYYPLIAALAFLLSRQPWKWRITGMALGILLVAVSVFYTSHKMEEVTGSRQFSAFGGWQMANNALYMYEHIPAKERGNVPARFGKLDKMVREHMDTLSKVKLSAEDSANTYFYLWSGRGPLIQYLEREWKKDSTTPYFKRWAAEAPLYQDYAFYLIRKYPLAYLQNFLTPNAVKYAVPPMEFLGIYNMGADSVGKLAKDWFNYKSLKVKEPKDHRSATIFTNWYPIFTAMVNALFVLTVLGMLFLGGFKKNMKIPVKLVLIVLLLWGLNASFSILASPIVLRYQFFPTLILFCLTLSILEPFYKGLVLAEQKNKPAL